MKRIFFIIILVGLVIGCKKSDDTKIEKYKINDGCYTDRFYYQGNDYWSIFLFLNVKKQKYFVKLFG